MDATADRPREVRVVTSTHVYRYSMRNLAWWTLGITAVMGGLYFLVGFPPAFDTYYEKMYFHAVGIGIAAIAAYLVIGAFDLEAHEPHIDFPIRYRAFLAVVFGALGGLVYLNKDVFLALPDIGVLLFLVAFVLIFDVAGALLVELIVLPRKTAGIYDSQSHNLLDYLGRLVPSTSADRATYRRLGVGYWLTVASIASMLIAMIIGFMNLWVRALGPSIFGGYMGWLGLDKAGFEDATLDPHSHMIAIAIIAMLVAVAAVRFGILNSESRVRRSIAQWGAWIAVVGVALTTLVLGAVAFLNFAPPTLFTSGPNDVNGMAGDDLIMAIVFVGAVVVAGAMLGERRLARDPLRLTILGTWVAAVLITVVEGFYIELNEASFGSSLATNDAAFAAAHPMTGIFLMMILSLALLLVDLYRIEGVMRAVAIAVGATGLIAAVAGTTFWTFVDPSTSGPSYVVYIAGIVITYLTVVVASAGIRSIHTPPIGDSVSEA